MILIKYTRFGGSTGGEMLSGKADTSFWTGLERSAR